MVLLITVNLSSLKLIYYVLSSRSTLGLISLTYNVQDSKVSDVFVLSLCRPWGICIRNVGDRLANGKLICFSCTLGMQRIDAFLLYF